jgi:osmotically-inducible protein OsmY
MSNAESDQYLCERVRQALAADERVGELDVHVTIAAAKLFLTGAVPTPERRDAVGTVAHEVLPEHDVHNDVILSSILSSPPEERL